jgi:hypothetical protein
VVWTLVEVVVANLMREQNTLTAAVVCETVVVMFVEFLAARSLAKVRRTKWVVSVPFVIAA